MNILFFISGAIASSSVVISLYFLRLWRRERDRLFLVFSISFFLLFVERLILIGQPDFEVRPYVFLVRLLAFLLIVLAICDKNIGNSR